MEQRRVILGSLIQYIKKIRLSRFIWCLFLFLENMQINMFSLTQIKSLLGLVIIAHPHIVCPYTYEGGGNSLLNKNGE